MSGGDIRCSAVIVAAGSAQRMQGIDKLLAPLDSVPVLRRTVEALASAPEITELIVVTRADRLEAVQALCEGLSKPVSVVPGGKTRAESVLCGLSAAAMPYVAIHDGARPLVTNEVIAQAVSAAVSCGAAAPAVPVHDTIKRAESGLVLETPDRSTLFAVQTPQVFRTEEIRSVLRWAIAQGLPLTDDCSAMEAAGRPVRLTPGDVKNLKITTPVDLRIAEAIWKGRTT